MDVSPVRAMMTPSKRRAAFFSLSPGTEIWTQTLQPTRTSSSASSRPQPCTLTCKPLAPNAFDSPLPAHLISL